MGSSLTFSNSTSERYALALYELAKEKSELLKIEEEAKGLKDLMISSMEFKKMIISKIPSGELGTGEEVSYSVALLASDMANYINGETIHVNGGMYMAWQFYSII